MPQRHREREKLELVNRADSPESLTETETSDRDGGAAAPAGPPAKLEVSSSVNRGVLNLSKF